MTTIAPPLPRSITAAERQVVELLWADKRVREIAKELGMKVPTVRSHVRSAAAKLPNPHNLPAVRLIRSFDPAHIGRASERED